MAEMISRLFLVFGDLLSLYLEEYPSVGICQGFFALKLEEADHRSKVLFS